MIRHLENILIGVNRWLIILEIGRLIRTLHTLFNLVPSPSRRRYLQLRLECEYDFRILKQLRTQSPRSPLLMISREVCYVNRAISEYPANSFTCSERFEERGITQ